MKYVQVRLSLQILLLMGVNQDSGAVQRIRNMPDLHACLDHAMLKRENRVYGGSPGVSDGCREGCFKPAFLDQETGTVYVSRHPNGHVATFHTLDGLPDEVVTARYANGNVSKAKHTLVSGFLKDCIFYTRQEAAAIVDTNRRE
jgi:hypothetical protein